MTHHSLVLISMVLALLAQQSGCTKRNGPSVPDGRMPVSIKVGTYNIESPSETKQNKVGYWPNRRDACIDLLDKEDFDILGTQEASDRMVGDLVAGLPRYGRISAERKKSDSRNSILYKTDRFEVLGEGHFFFSPTPDVDFSFDPDDSEQKDLYCVWGKFRDRKTGMVFYLFNSHIHAHRTTVMRDTLRCRDARTLKSKVVEIAGETLAICTGDFNCGETFVNNLTGEVVREEDPGYVELCKGGLLVDARPLAKTRKNDQESTIPGFLATGASKTSNTIDHIFLYTGARGGYQVNGYQKIITSYKLVHQGNTETQEGIVPGQEFSSNTSDHRPVAVSLYLLAP